MAFYNEHRKTIQCDDCPLLLSQLDSKRHSHCEEHRQVLNHLLHCLKSDNRRDQDRTSSDSHTTYKSLSSSEKDERMKRLHLQSRNAKQRIARLTQRIEKLTEGRGVVVDGLNEYLSDITKEHSTKISDQYPERSFEETKLSLPVMIWWCLYLRHLAGGSAYEMLRESGTIVLPLQRTLRYCTYVTMAQCCFSDEVDELLMEIAKIGYCEEKDKYVILLMDEMHIREDIVYDKHSGEFIKFGN